MDQVEPLVRLRVRANAERIHAVPARDHGGAELLSNTTVYPQLHEVGLRFLSRKVPRGCLRAAYPNHCILLHSHL